MYSDPTPPLFQRFLADLPQWKDPRTAWHRLFHRNTERWTLVQFRDSSDGFYHSRHAVTCERCGIRHTVHRTWPKFNADRNHGFLLAEAHQRAIHFAGQA